MADLYLVRGASAGGTADLFDIDWENAPGPTFPSCSFADLTNDYTGGGIGLVDYGPSNACSASIAAIVTDELCPGGSRSLRTSFPTGFGTQGPDFRIENQLTGSNTNVNGGGDVYFRFYVKWSSNFWWRQSDQKVVIWGGYHDGITGQDYYFQTRGLSGNRTAKVVLYTVNVDQTGNDSFVRATNVTISPDTWYRWEVWAHYASGTDGFIKCRVDGVDLTWAAEAGATWDPNATNNSNFGGIKMIKPDGTYNGYDDTTLQDWITNNGTMYKWYGKFAGGTTGWIGA